MTVQQLRRELGIGGASVTGLGSILGTGAFVSIGLASANWGDAVLYAIPLAALVAVFNGLSSAFLAGRFPVAGGTYEYGYRALNPMLGFVAGWLFLLAKTASAASAALGVAFYLGADGSLVPLLAVAGVTIMVIAGIRRTAALNLVLILITIAALTRFATAGISGETLQGIEIEGGGVLPAVAFLFVAYTGYGRIATLGEEVEDPKRVIPRAVIVTLVITAILYIGVGLGGRGLGGAFWGRDLDVTSLGLPLVTAGAVTAMLGVLLNLILGLSRVWLAMGRRGDMPGRVGRLDTEARPITAVILSAAAVAVVTLIGDISVAWSFSAMTVLLYYGITNLAAIKIDHRRGTAWAGLGSCLFLSFFVPPTIWAAGAALIGLGVVWKTVLERRAR